MKKFLLALAIIVMVTIPAALAVSVTTKDDSKTKSATGTSINATATAIGTITLDLDKETLGVSGSYDGWSLNGTSWKLGAMTAKDIAKFLDKGGNLYLAKGLTDKKKLDTEGGYVVEALTAIDKRPKANIEKLKILYTDKSDLSGSEWNLSKDGKVTAGSITSYEYWISDDGKAKPDDTSTWTACSTTNIAVKSLADGDPKPKTTYYFRSKAVAGTTDVKAIPAGKAWKVKPAVMGKAPKLKADYKKGIVAMKKGTINVAAATVTSAASQVSIAPDVNVTEMSFALAATGKKPGSAVQKLKIAPRLTTPSGSLSIENGKIKDEKLKTLEFARTATATSWGKLPALSTTTSLFARVKGNAKLKDDSFGTTGATSKAAALTITYEKDSTTNKVGVKSAVFGAEVQ